MSASSPAEEFFVGVYETAVHEGELLTTISVPTRAPGSGDSLQGVTLGAHGTYIANAAATVGADVLADRARLRRGRPAAGHGVEELLEGAEITPERVADAVAGLGASLDPPGDVHASAAYRPTWPRSRWSAPSLKPPNEGRGSRVSVSPASSQVVSVTVNGETYERDVPARRLLVHLLRDELDLTGTHIGCDTGSCGACTVLVDGVAVKSCAMLAVQADGATITTVEGLAATAASCHRSRSRSTTITRSSAATARPGC